MDDSSHHTPTSADSLPNIADQSLTFNSMKFRWENFLRYGVEGDTFHFIILAQDAKKHPFVRAFATIAASIGETPFTLVMLNLECGERSWEFEQVVEGRVTAPSDYLLQVHARYFQTLCNVLEATPS